MADNRYRERGNYGRSDSIFSDDDRSSGSGYGGSERHRGGRSDHDRGFFEKAGEEVRSWFSDDDDRGGRDSAKGASSGRSYEGRAQSWGGGSDWNNRMGSRYRQQQGGGSPFDDHYRSWRDEQIGKLDRDYEEYCRHRQQKFESDFSDWRKNRRNEQTGIASGRTGEGRQAQGSGTTSARKGGSSETMSSGGSNEANETGTGGESARSGRSNKSK